MPSMNNIYMAAGKPYKQFVKTVPSRVAGLRIDPMHRDRKVIGFVLASNGGSFDPEQEVIALYSEEETLYFLQANRSLVQLGLLKEWTDKEDPVLIDYTNFLSDEEVNSIASLKSLAALKEKLSPITSPVTMERIVRTAEEIGTRKNLLDYMRVKLAELS